MERDFAAIGQDEIAVGQEAEVRRDFVVADARYAPGYKFLLGHLSLFVVAGIDGDPKPQPLQGVAVERGMKRVFIAVPEIRGRPPRIAESVHIQAPEALGVSDHL